jgi:hypothetical protein
MLKLKIYLNYGYLIYNVISLNLVGLALIRNKPKNYTSY